VDWGSLVGIVLALGGILAGQVLEGGHVSSLVQPAAFVIVIVGTTGAVILQSGLPAFARGVMMVGQVFSPRPDNYRELREEMIRWSLVARREGFLGLERYLVDVKDPFVRQGLRLVVDGVEPGKMRELLEAEITAYEVRERAAIKIWESAGGYSPTIGILGAVLGLIHVMENLSDPSKLGSGIAVAFVATIYGVGFANLLFLPIGSRLKTLVNKEVRKMEMLTDAFFALVTGENPRLIEERMGSFLK
jgi:chemotaxis protein MotA